MAKSQEEYIKNPNRCPVCDGQVEGDSVEIENTQAVQEVWCIECGARWWDVYNLVGYTELQEETNGRMG